ncbi:MAG: glycine cleavage system protein GcvH [Chitinophagaceae bacterium]|nr:glycine cleavage system protein GcvH [Chitinophagaceae bacterium]
MNTPSNVLYTKDHEWVKVEGDILSVGITDFAQNELGDIVYVEFPEVGDKKKAGEVFGTVEAVKTVSDLFMPVSGEIIEVNTRLNTSPELVNKKPYEDGWMIKVKISDTKELDALLQNTDYRRLIEK